MTKFQLFTVYKCTNSTFLLLSSWYDIGCLVLEDPLTGTKLVTFTQATPVPSECVNCLKFETPSDYPFRDTGFALTIGQKMSQQLQVENDEWHEALVGIPRRSIIYLAACALARLFKDKVNR